MTTGTTNQNALGNQNNQPITLATAGTSKKLPTDKRTLIANPFVRSTGKSSSRQGKGWFKTKCYYDEVMYYI